MKTTKTQKIVITIASSFLLISIFSPIFSQSLKKNEIIFEGGVGQKQTLAGDYFHSSDTPCMLYKPSIESDGIYLAEEEGTCATGAGIETLNFLLKSLSGETKMQFDDTGKVTAIWHNNGLTEDLIVASGNLYTSPPVEPASVWAQNTFNDIKNKINPIETVEAQEDSSIYFPGRGYDILKPIQKIWSMNQNLCYGLLIIVVLVNAFIILFKGNKGDITFMNSIPSVILSLLLITFSYALSGAFIDLMTIGSNFVQSVLLSNPAAPGYESVWTKSITYDDTNVPAFNNKTRAEILDELNKLKKLGGTTDPDFYTTEDVIEAKYGVQIDDPLVSTWLIFGTSNQNITSKDLTSIDLLPDEVILNSTITPIGGIVSMITKFGNLFGGKVGNAGMSLASMILNLVFALAAFMASIKVFFNLLKSYIVLIIYPIFSPFIFLIAAIPSMTQKMINSFVNTMLGASMSFVAVYAVYLMILIITNLPAIDGFNGFVPPLLGYDANNLVGVGGHLVRMIVGYGLFLSSPLIAEKVPEFFVSGKLDISRAGKDIGSYTAQAAGTIVQGVRAAAQIAHSLFYPKK